MALPINFNPYQPIPNNPFYYPEGYNLSTPSGWLIVGSNLNISSTGIISASGGGGSGTVTNVTGVAPVQVATGATTPVISIDGASTSGPGIVQLNDSTTSTSTTEAATANAVKTAYDAATAAAATAANALPLAGGTMSGPIVFAAGQTIPVSGIPSASTTQVGVVQLNDTLTSTSTTEAATANAVKTAYDAAVAAAAAAAGSVQSVTGTAPVAITGTATDPVIGIDASSTTSPGIVQLNDSTTSTSTTEAATANAVKTAYDAAVAAAAAAAGSVQSVTGTAPVAITGTATDPVVGVDAASTTAAGVVQLYNATDSTSTALALTAAQGKNLQDQIDALAVASNITLAGTLDASTGLLSSVTAAGTAAGFAVGSPLPAAALANQDYFVIADVAAASYTPPGGVATQVHIGDWFLSDGAAWQFLDVGFQAAYATTTDAGVIELSTDAETQAGTDAILAVTPASLQSKLSDSTALTSSTTIASSTAVKSAFDVASAAIPCATLLAKGDLIVATGASVPTSLTVGADGFALVADSTCATGVKWASVATAAATPTTLGTVLGCTVTTTTAIGCNALLAAPTAPNNTALGYNAGAAVTTGSRNTAVGSNALCTNALSWGNTAIGFESLRASGNGGDYNTAVGSFSMAYNTTGRYNTAVGFCAMLENSTGRYNTAVGANAIANALTGCYNTAVGQAALVNTDVGFYNAALGFQAGSTNIDGSCNVFIGNNVQAPSFNTSCHLVIGFANGQYWLTGNSNKTIKPGAGVEDCAGSCGTAGQVLMSDGANAVCWGSVAGTPQATPTLLGTVFGCTLGTNAGLGSQALLSNGSIQNTAVGGSALRSNAIGSANTAAGYNALRLNTDGSNNTADGACSLYTNTLGNYNTASGFKSLFGNQSGSYNTAIGYESGSANQTGSCNVFIGNNVQPPNYNTSCYLAIGFANGQHWLTGNSNKTIKPGAGIEDCAGSCGTAGQVLMSDGANAVCWATAAGTPVATSITLGTVYGVQDCLTGTSGCGNTAYGYGALRVVDPDPLNAVSRNTAFGYCALPNVSGFDQDNVAVGYCTLAGLNGPGARNTAVGSCALRSLVNGNDHVAIGRDAMCSQVTGSGNVAIGTASLCNNTANGMTAVGNNALCSNTTGSTNTAVGSDAMRYNLTGTQNTVVGNTGLAANGNTTSSCNTVMGHSAMSLAGASNLNSVFGWCALNGVTLNANNYFENVAIGAQALGNATTGASFNTAVGSGAACNLTTGAGNVVIGSLSAAGALSPAYNVTTENDYVSIGSLATTNAYINVAWTVVSDARDKIVQGAVPHGLEFVKQLDPKAYQLKKDRASDTSDGRLRYGFLAQDILALEGAESVIIDASDSEKLRYNSDALIPVLVNAIKELSAKVEDLEAKLAK